MSDLSLLPEGFSMHAHIPHGAAPDLPVLVAVHGISRNAHEHLDAFAEAAGDRCAVLVPRFDADRFPSYQRLGIGRDEPRADLLLDATLGFAVERAGLSARAVHGFGFSGGAQFIQRFAMLQPGRFGSLHLASAGWYTYFGEKAPWPRGCGRDPVGRRILANEAFFRRIPCHVHVGARDDLRDDTLRTGPRIDAQQGATRVERAVRWVDHLRARRGTSRAALTLNVLPDCGHDFAAACRPEHGALARTVIRTALGDAAVSRTAA
jgi:pimeloyl-ACP methyl ester carboxylesterase